MAEPRIWFVYDVKPFGATEWRRGSFCKLRVTPVDEEPTDEEYAWKAGGRFRLVRITEEIVGEEFENFAEE
jgi:hypothetical protein